METNLMETEPPWAVTPEKVDAVIHRLVEHAHPAKVYVFGSYLNPKPDGMPPNDLDLLVVVDDSVLDENSESARLRRLMRGIRMPMDIIVVRSGKFGAYAQVPGLLF